LVAMRLLVNSCKDETYLFSTYLKDGKLQVTYASNALNKWIRKRFEDRTAHCLRHTFRDRLRAVECPLEMLDALGGWSSIGTAGSRYGRGYRVEHKREWLEKIVLDGVSAAQNC
jgi:integrase